MDKTEFTITTKPVAIEFECPHCENEVSIPWDEVNVPGYWGDDWDDMECPYCHKMVALELEWD